MENDEEEILLNFSPSVSLPAEKVVQHEFRDNGLVDSSYPSHTAVPVESNGLPTNPFLVDMLYVSSAAPLVRQPFGGANPFVTDRTVSPRLSPASSTGRGNTSTGQPSLRMEQPYEAQNAASSFNSYTSTTAGTGMVPAPVSERKVLTKSANPSGRPTLPAAANTNSAAITPSLAASLPVIGRPLHEFDIRKHFVASAAKAAPSMVAMHDDGDVVASSNHESGGEPVAVALLTGLVSPPVLSDPEMCASVVHRRSVVSVSSCLAA